MSGDARIWATSEDGSLEYVSITKDLLQSSLEAMQRSFYIHESVCVAFDMHNQPESFSEMDVLLLRAARDGVSIAVIEKHTGKIAGAAFNKLEEPGQVNFYPEYIEACNHTASKGVGQWMSDIENMFDIFEHCHVKSVMEIMFVGVVPEFRKRGIAKKLFEVSIELARTLKSCQNVKVPINDEDCLELGSPPELVTGIFTSFVTQKIGKDLGFNTGVQIGFDKFVYDGKSLGDVIDKSTSYLTYDYLKL